VASIISYPKVAGERGVESVKVAGSGVIGSVQDAQESLEGGEGRGRMKDGIIWYVLNSLFLFLFADLNEDLQISGFESWPILIPNTVNFSLISILQDCGGWEDRRREDTIGMIPLESDTLKGFFGNCQL